MTRPAALRTSLEQQRAAHAWQTASKAPNADFRNLAKGLPALIMSSGLLQTLAFLNEKSPQDPKDALRTHHGFLLAALLDWLARRSMTTDRGFHEAMTELIQAPPSSFRQVTLEAMAWLRWLRHFAGAVTPDSRDQAESFER